MSEGLIRTYFFEGGIARVIVEAVIQTNADKSSIFLSEQQELLVVTSLGEEAQLKVANSYLSINGGYFDLVVDFLPD